MIDRDFLRSKVAYDNEDEHKIQDGDFIPQDVIEMLMHKSVEQISSCFAKASKKTSERKGYRIITTCHDCGKPIETNVCKTTLIYQLASNDHIGYCYCEECETKRKQQAKLTRKQRELKNAEHFKMLEEQKKERTCDYIEGLLDPRRSFNDNVDLQQQIEYVMGYDVDNQTIADYIKKMDYKTFLQTQYWKTIAASKKQDVKYKCELCGNKGNLQVHHKTYENHGYEHLHSVYRKDLIVLCGDCHERIAHKNKHSTHQNDLKEPNNEN